jgi:hypothetical protein
VKLIIIAAKSNTKRTMAMLVPAGTYDAHCCVLPEGVVEKSSSQQLGIGVQY